jgi:hypothetical protein
MGIPKCGFKNAVSKQCTTEKNAVLTAAGFVNAVVGLACGM